MSPDNKSTAKKGQLCHEAQAIALFSSHVHLFTKSDTALANFIALHIDQFMHMTILDLANATGLSEITISRFCKKLGLAGIHALKINLAYIQPSELTTHSSAALNPEVAPQAAALLGAQLGANQRAFTPEDSTQQICTEVFATISAGLTQTLNLLDYDAIDQAAELINQSTRLLFFGFGNSSVVCHDLGTRFARFGISCEIVSDLHQQMTIAAVCGAETVILAVSFSGSSLHLDEVLQLARSRGAKVILFTSYKNSAIAQQADVVLMGVCPELKNNTEAATSRLIYMAIGDVLYTRLTLLRSKQYQDNLKSIRSSLALLRT